MADTGNSLTKAFDYVHARLLDRLAGLGDGEYFWEPVPGCWSVRQGVDDILTGLSAEPARLLGAVGRAAALLG